MILVDRQAGSCMGWCMGWCVGWCMDAWVGDVMGCYKYDIFQHILGRDKLNMMHQKIKS